jgi:excisionase family DNA binding protein
MNTSTETIIRAALDADKTVNVEQRNAAVAILNGCVPQKLPDFIVRSFSPMGAANRATPVAMTSSKSYLRRGEAAKYLSCCVREIDQLKHDGDLPFCRLGRRLIVFRISDLDALMQKRRISIDDDRLAS